MSNHFVAHSQCDKKSICEFLSLRGVRTPFVLRCLVILLVAAGWFVVSNHCAVGMGLKMAQLKGAHECCENGKVSSAKDHPEPGGAIICCKAVHAVVHDPANVNNLKPDLAHALFAVAWLLEFEHQDECRTVLSIRGNAAPPSAISFSELVLQRSLLAHAPPSLS